MCFGVDAGFLRGWSAWGMPGMRREQKPALSPRENQGSCRASAQTLGPIHDTRNISLGLALHWTREQFHRAKRLKDLKQVSRNVRGSLRSSASLLVPYLALWHSFSPTHHVPVILLRLKSHTKEVGMLIFINHEIPSPPSVSS